MNNLLSYWGLVDAKIRASDKDLPVHLREHSVYILSLLFNEEKVSERDYVIKNLRSDVVCTFLYHYRKHIL